MGTSLTMLSPLGRHHVLQFDRTLFARIGRALIGAASQNTGSSNSQSSHTCALEELTTRNVRHKNQPHNLFCMPPSLFCGACFSYIIPPPRNSLSSGFWHLFPPDAEKQERPRENRKFRQARQKGPLHSIPYSGPFCSPLFSFILNMSCFHLLSAHVPLSSAPVPLLPPASARQTKKPH